MITGEAIAGSFRDPSGFLFTHKESLYRQVNGSYAVHFDRLVGSGLYDELVRDELLIPHEPADMDMAQSSEAVCVLKPRLIPFVSFPYEWSFGQLRAAALLTLEIQRRALEKGMVLKDASAYNVQFIGARPVFIDTLSFEIYEKGSPWVAYRQFCQHFLAPLALMSYVDERMGLLSQTYIDGVPLGLAANLLPLRAKLKPSLYTHLVLHARTQEKYADVKQKSAKSTRQVSDLGLRGLIDNLTSTIRKLEWQHPDSEWGDYYEDTNYEAEAMLDKQEIVGGFFDAIGACHQVVDLGANTGLFSTIAREFADVVVSLDIDPVAVDRNFRQRSETGDDRVLPLRVDLAAPSPAIGWANDERPSIAERVDADAMLALALVHHLAISNNVPLGMIAEFCSRLTNYLIIEFVPKSDSQVARLLQTREDVFPSYTRECFEAEFADYFSIEASHPVARSERVLYLMKRL